jgi:hypothetical protein
VEEGAALAAQEAGVLVDEPALVLARLRPLAASDDRREVALLLDRQPGRDAATSRIDVDLLAERAVRLILPPLVRRTRGSRTPPPAKCSKPGCAATCSHCHASTPRSINFLTSQGATSNGLSSMPSCVRHVCGSTTTQPILLSVR